MAQSNQIEHFYESIHGWSSGIDLLYKQIIDSIPKKTTQLQNGKFVEISPGPFYFVEVGSWRGRSSAYMAVEIANSGKNIKFTCVDTWQGSSNESSHVEDDGVKAGTLYDEFLQNIHPVREYITPLRLTSVEAASIYPDNTLDFVFIDADHSYEAVREDIIAWLPKVKQGGLLAGHDYNPEGDHGVGKAVRELFPLEAIQSLPWCWAVGKG